MAKPASQGNIASPRAYEGFRCVVCSERLLLFSEHEQLSAGDAAFITGELHHLGSNDFILSRIVEVAFGQYAAIGALQQSRY